MSVRLLGNFIFVFIMVKPAGPCSFLDRGSCRNAGFVLSLRELPCHL